MLAKAADGTIQYKSLSPNEQKQFDAARAKEMEALFELGAYRIMSVPESRDFRRKHPEHVLRTRYVDRWKPTDDGGVIAKSRIVILGFQDPQVYQLERSAPTPTNEGFTTMMQFLASNKYKCCSSDIKKAF